MHKYTDYINHYKIDAEFFDYFSKDKFTRQQDRRRYQQIYHLVKPLKGQRILEVGSGGGEALHCFQMAEIHYFPLDISFKNLNRIKNMAQFPVRPVSADVFHLPFHDNTFDIIILSEVLEHLDNPLEAIQKIKRILNPSGKLIISVPYKEEITYQFCIHCNKPTPTFAHLHSYDEKILAGYLTIAGFISDKILKACNKVLKLIGLDIIFVKMSFRFWKISDCLFNFIIPKPSYLFIVARK